MKRSWTQTQLERLAALDADSATLELRFENSAERNRVNFSSSRLTLSGSSGVDWKSCVPKPGVLHFVDLKVTLVDALVGKGFVQVATPTIMSRALLAKMSISESHPLTSQIYWLRRRQVPATDAGAASVLSVQGYAAAVGKTGSDF